MDMVIDDPDYAMFKKKVMTLTGLDLNSYKQKQMYRRLNSLLSRQGFHSYLDYYKVLEKDAEKLQEFKNFVTINVTEFLRNPDKFEDLTRHILPELVKNSPSGLKIWSAGCSCGAEAYTLAMIMQENFPIVNYSVLATDIDQEMLERAQRGVYGEGELRNLPPALLGKYFKKTDKEYEVQERLKKNVVFKRNNLLQDRFETGFDLILCRNVVIYFTEEAKTVLYEKFYQSLKSNGVLFVGGTENILSAKEIGFTSPRTFFYKKAFPLTNTGEREKQSA